MLECGALDARPYSTWNAKTKQLGSECPLNLELHFVLHVPPDEYHGYHGGVGLHPLLPRKKGPAQKQRDKARAAAHRAKQAEETAVAADSSVKKKQDSTESPVAATG